MKKVVLVILLFATIPMFSRAQFLKTLVQNAKNSIAGHPAAGSATGKKDSSSQAGASQANALDSTALVQRFAQMSKAGVPAGPSVSPADSAAAIQSFKTATGGSGQYYEYLLTYTFSKKGSDSVFRDTMSTAMTDAHFGRTDFSLLGSKTVIINRASMPRYSVMLNTGNRTYALHLIDTAAINRSDGWTYQVTKLGTERVGAFDCIHARVTMSKPGTKQSITEEVWNSTQVPGYAVMKKLASLHNVTPQFMRALDQTGCDGFIVKMSMHGVAYSMEMLLAQATRKDFPAADFEIPAGYSPARTINPASRVFQQ